MAEADLRALLEGLSPEPVPGVVHFCKVGFEDARLGALVPQARATFREAEDMTLVLEEGLAVAEGLAGDQPMAQITLGVYSSLEAVGLTAAVAAALGGEGIACNMIAAYHHDHAFVPAAKVEAAVACLKGMSGQNA